MTLILLVAGIHFSIIDIKSHRISNISLIYLTLILLIFSLGTGHDLYFESALIAFVVGIFFSFVAGLGFGDVKLLAILVLFTLSPEVAEVKQFVLGLLLSTVILLLSAVLVSAKNQRRMPSMAGKFMPFAPCIFAGSILCTSFS